MKDLQIQDPDVANDVTLTASKTSAIKIAMRNDDYDNGCFVGIALSPDNAKLLGTWLLEASK